MKEIKSLSSEQLLNEIKISVGKERRITVQIIAYLEEIERRRLYSAQGFSSLFEYCVKELGYSESQTHRRIVAMRVSRELPETKAAIAEGALSLASIAMAQRFFNSEEKAVGKKLEIEEKRSVLTDLQKKSKREAERILAERCSAPLLAPVVRESFIKGQQTRLELTLSEAQMAKLRRVQELLSHQIPDGDWVKVIEKMAELTLEKIAPELKQERREKRKKKELVTSTQASPRVEADGEEKSSYLDEVLQGVMESLVQSEPRTNPSVKSQVLKCSILGSLSPGKVRSRYIPAPLRALVMIRAGHQCEFLDPLTGRRCSNRRYLEIDHKYAWALGGEHSLQNLSVACRSHNLHRAVETFGVAKMGRWIRAD